MIVSVLGSTDYLCLIQILFFGLKFVERECQERSRRNVDAKRRSHRSNSGKLEQGNEQEASDSWLLQDSGSKR